MNDPRLAARVLRDAPIAVLVLDLDGVIRHTNPCFERLTGVQAAEVEGKGWVDTFFPERDTTWIHSALQGDVSLLRDVYDGRLEWTVDRLHDDEDRGTGFVAIARERRPSSAEQQAQLLDLIFEHSLDQIVVLDKEFNFVRVSETYSKGCQIPVAELLGRNHFDLFPSEFEQEIAPYRRDRQVYSRSARPFVYPDHPEWGVTYWDLTVVPMLDAVGEAEFFLLSLKDVTEHRRTLETLRATLREREMLLREIHHRVKNNLQVISSLMYFHERRLRAPEDVAALIDLRRRLLAMTLVHEHLYRSADVGRVDFAEYVRTLVHALTLSFGARDGIHFEVHVEEVFLPIEQAVPSGMILSELVTNVWKHAFPDGRSGRARVSLRAVDEHVQLVVEDDGPGTPDGFPPGGEGPFGWDLVRALVEQLAGKVDVTSSAGTRVSVRFPTPRAMAS